MTALLHVRPGGKDGTARLVFVRSSFKTVALFAISFSSSKSLTEKNNFYQACEVVTLYFAIPLLKR